MKKNRKPQKVSQILDRFLKKSGLSVQICQFEIVEKWADIVGESIAEVTMCREFSKNILYVTVSSAAWRNELVYCKEELIKKIEKTIPETTIKDIVFQ